MKNGGYVIIDLTKDLSTLAKFNAFTAELDKAYESNAPILAYGKDGRGEFMSASRYYDSHYKRYYYILENSKKIFSYVNAKGYMEYNREEALVLNSSKFTNLEFIRDCSCVVHNSAFDRLVLSIYNVEAGNISFEAGDTIATLPSKNMKNSRDKYHAATFDEDGEAVSDWIPIQIVDDGDYYSIITLEDFTFGDDCTLYLDTILS